MSTFCINLIVIAIYLILFTVVDIPFFTDKIAIQENFKFDRMTEAIIEKQRRQEKVIGKGWHYIHSKTNFNVHDEDHDGLLDTTKVNTSSIFHINKIIVSTDDTE